MHRSRACAVLQMDNQLSRPGDGYRSSETSATRRGWTTWRTATQERAWAALRHRTPLIWQKRKMAEGGGIWACMAFAFFCPRFFCPLELRASFVRVAGFDQPTPVPHPRSSRLFLLLTSHRRRSASVSEILNVAPLRSNSLDGCPSSNSESQIWRPKRRDPNPRGSETPGIKKPGRRKLGLSNLWREKPLGSQPPGSRRNQRQLLEHNVFPAFGLSARAASRNGCLPRLAPRGMITSVVLDDGRRRAVDRGQLEPMNNPMHTRRRRRPRT